MASKRLNSLLAVVFLFIAFKVIAEWRRHELKTEQPASGFAPPTAEEFYNLGIALSHDSRLEEAIEAYTSALELNPQFGHALSNRAKARGELGQQDAAIADANRALVLDPEDHVAHMTKSYALLAKKDYKAALAAVDEALKTVHIDRQEFLKQRGHVNGKLGRYEEAIADTHRAIKMAPRDASLYGNLAIFYANLNDKVAIEYIRKGHEIDPNDPKVRELWEKLPESLRVAPAGE